MIGTDTGGTKTVGRLADENGKVPAKTISGGAHLVMKGELAVEKVLNDVIESLEAPEPEAGQLVFPGHFLIVFAGEAFKACPSLSRRLEVLLDASEMDVRLLDVEPVMGAVTLALEQLQGS